MSLLRFKSAMNLGMYSLLSRCLFHDQVEYSSNSLGHFITSAAGSQVCAVKEQREMLFL